MTTEVYAANGEQPFSEQLYAIAPEAANWLDLTTQERPTVFLGQAIRDPNPINLLEFWNRSLTGVWSLDATAPGPGATATPNLVKPDGTLTPPHTAFVVATPGVDVAGTAGRRRRSPATRCPLLDGSLRLRTAQTGIYPDGWMGALATLSQYDVPPRASAGSVRRSTSRGRGGAGTTCGASSTASVGPVGDLAGRRAADDRAGDGHARAASSTRARPKTLRAADASPRPWRAEVKIDPDVRPGRSSTRRLGDPRRARAPSSRSRTCPDDAHDRLGVLAHEARHPAQVPERVPREEAPVDHGGVVVA